MVIKLNRSEITINGIIEEVKKDTYIINKEEIRLDIYNPKIVGKEVLFDLLAKDNSGTGYNIKMLRGDGIMFPCRVIKNKIIIEEAVPEEFFEYFKEYLNKSKYTWEVLVV